MKYLKCTKHFLMPNYPKVLNRKHIDLWCHFYENTFSFHKFVFDFLKVIQYRLLNISLIGSLIYEQESGIKLTTDEINMLLDELDRDGDGEINYRSVLKFLIITHSWNGE